MFAWKLLKLVESLVAAIVPPSRGGRLRPKVVDAMASTDKCVYASVMFLASLYSWN